VDLQKYTAFLNCFHPSDASNKRKATMFITAEKFTPDFANSQPSSQVQAAQLDLSLMWRVLDEIDYGLILVTPEGQLQHANHLGRYELARGKFLGTNGPRNCAAKGQLQTNSATATAELLSGIRAAARGRRQMLTMRQGPESLSLACVPLRQPFEGACASVLLMLGRQNDTANLALGFYARSHKLSSTEENVLRALCNGQQIADIAIAHGVAESTVRTQVRALRDKTQCNSIRLLVQQVAALPPVVPVSLTAQNTTHRT
jgi:DNA-binding CsgD family transcriptional regulator